MLNDAAALVRQIVAFNHSWKRAVDRWGAQHPIAQMLRDRKTCLQIDLLRFHPDTAWLCLDADATEEPLYSVRLGVPVRLTSGVMRRDAEHLPVRLAERWLAPDELQTILRS